MTKCVKGDHEFPVEDETGAYCAEDGVTLLWHGPPITPEDFTPEPHASRATPLPALPALLRPDPRGDSHPT